MAKKIYLDVCCLNRPLDDQSQEKVRLEAEAVLQILRLCEKGVLKIFWSEMIDFELARISDRQKREKLLTLARFSEAEIMLDEELRNRARELQRLLNVKPNDAFHLACAERSKSDVFLTTDQDLLKKARKRDKMLTVEVTNPVEWLFKVV